MFSTHHSDDDGHELGESDGAGGVNEPKVHQDVGQVQHHEHAQEAQPNPSTVKVNYRSGRVGVHFSLQKDQILTP